MSKITVTPTKPDLQSSILFLLVTATDLETSCLHGKLQPLDGENCVIETSENGKTYFVGKLGLYNVVHVQCAMGAMGRDSSINTVSGAISVWNPDAVIMIGIAFGKDPLKQKIGDVLISQSIVDYESCRISKNRIIHRSDIPLSGKVLLDKFRSALKWKHTLKSGGKAVGLFSNSNLYCYIIPKS